VKELAVFLSWEEIFELNPSERQKQAKQTIYLFINRVFEVRLVGRTSRLGQKH
jgi:hypothetical protein